MKQSKQRRRSFWGRSLAGISLLFLVLVLTPTGQARAISSEGLALANFLNADGSLNLPTQGIQGSINPAGYELVSTAGAAPRFAPTSQPESPTFGSDDANWDPRFAGAGVNNTVRALAWDGTNLYVGGDFSSAGGVAASRIARWNGTNWSTLGSGMNNQVEALAWDGTGLYAGGFFTTAGGVLASRIARWDGTSWSALGSGVSSQVYSLAWNGTHLYVGGLFSTAGGGAANNIARWDGATWSALGSGTNQAVLTLAWDGMGLYAGGFFTTADGLAASRIARWDGTNWSALGSGLNSIVHALIWHGGNLYVGGDFSTAGGVTTRGLARWDGANWSDLGLPSPSSVSALASDGTNLYAGGSIYLPGGVWANRLARWDGTNWSALGSGLNNPVLALVWDGSSLYSSLYVGGQFTTAGNKLSTFVGRWRQAAVWDGGGGDNNGSTAANWSGNSVPLTTDVAIFDSASDKDVTLDGSFPVTLDSIVVEESYDGVITHNRNLALTEELQLHGGTFVVADPAANSLTVGGSVLHSGGTFSQTQTIANADLPFLQIEDGSANIKYRGVNINTIVTGGNNLGSTTVAIRAIDTGAGEFCTDDYGDSPAYAERCFQITPATDGPARVRLYALTSSELNGIVEGDLAVFRHYPEPGPFWVELTVNASTGNDGGSYSYAQADTPGFSGFLLGEQGNEPTAIDGQGQGSDLVANGWVTAGVLLAALALLVVSAGVWKRQLI
jgi:hypothetical protein